MGGPDGIENETSKALEIAIVSFLTKFFDKIITTGVIPKQWTKADIIVIYKRGGKSNIKNYRPISLTSNISKILMACIKNRMYNQLDRNQSKQQAGFRRGFSIIDNVFIINPLIEKTDES